MPHATKVTVHQPIIVPPAPEWVDDLLQEVEAINKRYGAALNAIIDDLNAIRTRLDALENP